MLWEGYLNKSRLDVHILSLRLSSHTRGHIGRQKMKSGKAHGRALRQIQRLHTKWVLLQVFGLYFLAMGH